MSSVGGMDFHGFNSMLESAVADNKMTSGEADSIRSELAPTGLNTVMSSSTTVSDAVTLQTASVVNNLPHVISAANSYGSMKNAFDSSSTPDICTGIHELIGTLSGGIDHLFAAAHDALSLVSNLMSALSSIAKAAFTSAYAALSSLLSGTGGVVSGIISGISSFISNISSAVMSQISGLTNSISNKLSQISGAIHAELAAIGGMFEYLKNAAFSLSFPSLSPCAKDAVKACAGAAGAIALVALVS
jgi:phage-related protein